MKLTTFQVNKFRLYKFIRLSINYYLFKLMTLELQSDLIQSESEALLLSPQGKRRIFSEP